MKKTSFITILAICMVAITSINLLSSCSKDDDESVSIPSGLIGTWYKTSGASKYTMSFTFNSDGSGTGYITHNNIICVRTYNFTYSCKSNGDVVCKGTCVSVDESTEDVHSVELKFNYSGGSRMTGIETSNTAFAGCTFSK